MDTPKDIVPAGEEIVNNIWDFSNINSFLSDEPLLTRKMAKPEDGPPYFYEIGYFGYDSNNYVQLFHEKYYTKEEFRQMIAQVTAIVAKEKVELFESNTLRLIKEDGLSEYADLEANPLPIHFCDIYVLVANGLCKMFGFRKLPLSARYSIFEGVNLRQFPFNFNENNEDIIPEEDATPLASAVVAACGGYDEETAEKILLERYYSEER